MSLPGVFRGVIPPTTLGGRYFVVRGRLYSCTGPVLPAADRPRQTRAVMQARRDKGVALRAGDRAAMETARQRVGSSKMALGERGSPWWTDGAPDWNPHTARTIPYAAWFASLAFA